jgi:hypothetical protein
MAFLIESALARSSVIGLELHHKGNSQIISDFVL